MFPAAGRLWAQKPVRSPATLSDSNCATKNVNNSWRSCARSELGVARHYCRTMPARGAGPIVTGTVAANGRKLAFVTTACTV